MAKKYEDLRPIEIPANPRADLLIQERKKFEGKIKLENKLIDTSNNNVLQRVINCYQKQWYQIQEGGVTKCYINIFKL